MPAVPSDRTGKLDVTEEQKRVRSDSDYLLDALTALKDAEERKRRAPFSTEEFHELADEVEERAKGVWKAAAQEALDGEATSTTGAVIEDLHPEQD